MALKATEIIHKTNPSKTPYAPVFSSLFSSFFFEDGDECSFKIIIIDPPKHIIPPTKYLLYKGSFNKK